MADLTKTFNYNDGEHTVLTEITFRTSTVGDPSLPNADGTIYLHTMVQTIDDGDAVSQDLTTEALKKYLTADDDRWTKFFSGSTEPELVTFLGPLGFVAP